MFLITSFLSVVLLIVWNFPQQMETKKPSITFTKIECIDFNKENLETTKCLLYDLKPNVQSINMYIDIKNKSRNQIMVKNFKFLLKKIHKKYSPNCRFMDNCYINSEMIIVLFSTTIWLIIVISLKVLNVIYYGILYMKLQKNFQILIILVP